MSDDDVIDFSKLFKKNKAQSEPVKKTHSSTTHTHVEKPQTHHHNPESTHSLHHTEKKVHQPTHTQSHHHKHHHRHKHSVKHKHHDHKTHIVHHEKKKDDDSINLDFIKNIFKKKQSSHSSREESVDFDLKKHIGWIIPAVLMISIFIFAFQIRAQTVNLPATEDWAQDSVYRFYRNQIEAQINQQFPNLPQENKNALIDRDFAEVLEQNKDQIQQQVDATSRQFKERFRDSSGQTYLLGIDPFYYYRQSRNIMEYGNVGTEIRDGLPFDSYKPAPVGSYIEANLHPYVGVLVYQIMSLFSDISLMGAFFYVGALIAALSTIPAFLIGRRVGGNVGGFFSAIFLAVNIFFVSRTAGESSDTDAYNVFFPILIAWLFIESFEQKDIKKKLGLIGLTGVIVGLYSFTWAGWWFIWYFLLAAIGGQILYHAIKRSIEEKKLVWWDDSIKEDFLSLVTVIITTGISASILIGTEAFMKVVKRPFQFLQLKEVAATKIWPNVLTTVAELNPASLDSVVGQLGGNFFLFLAVAGIVLTLTQKHANGDRNVKYIILFGFWLIATLWSTSKGVRFTLLAVPAITTGIGFFCGTVYDYLTNFISSSLRVHKRITQVVLFGLLALLLFFPTNHLTAGYNHGTRSVPSMNDAWWDSLEKIKFESEPDAIITSWWDFGHWFKAIADRPVTFDGGSQNSPQAYWVGKLLLTPHENVSFGILRMLDCGGNTAFDKVDAVRNDIIESVDIVNEIIAHNEDGARDILEGYGFTQNQAGEILDYTHCTPPEGFVIASNDMIGKAGVWGHFGAWDFTKAAMVFETKNSPRADAIITLTEEFGLTNEEAQETYTDILTQDPNRWIAPWPGYLGGLQGCDHSNETIICPLQFQGGQSIININRSNMNATIPTGEGFIYPNSIVYVEGEDIVEKTFDAPTIGFSAMIIPRGEGFVVNLADSLQARSMFSQMFHYTGYGLDCFEPFDSRQQVTGGLIYVYKVNWDCYDNPRSRTIPQVTQEDALDSLESTLTTTQDQQDSNDDEDSQEEVENDEESVTGDETKEEMMEESMEETHSEVMSEENESTQEPVNESS